MVVDVVVQNPQKSNEYEYEKKHVRRDSRMCCCCCCCRFCCGAPTTDERIHAPVLHDASQIAYCTYWGRASLPPITSINTLTPNVYKNNRYLFIYGLVPGATAVRVEYAISYLRYSGVPGIKLFVLLFSNMIVNTWVWLFFSSLFKTCLLYTSPSPRD